MFGNFPFGQPYFGQPNSPSGPNISGSVDCTQQPNTCSATGTVPLEFIGGTTADGLLSFLFSRRKRYQQPIVSGSAWVIQSPNQMAALGVVSSPKPQQTKPARAAVDIIELQDERDLVDIIDLIELLD